MPIQMWTHGHAAQAEDPQLAIIERYGWGATIDTNYGFHVGSVIYQEHWIDFAIPTPTIVNGTPQKIIAVHLDFLTDGARSFINAINVWDGVTRIGVFDPIALSGMNPAATFPIPGTPVVTRGIGVSVKISILPDLPPSVRKIHIRGVGADFA